MKQTLKLLQKGAIAFTLGIFLIFTITACLDDLVNNGIEGNVIVSVETADRTIRPNDIASASIFERIEIEFSKEGELNTLTLLKPNTTGGITLEEGTWAINAFGYLMINGIEYEAARGSSSVTVEKSGSRNVSIDLRTGIFSGAPGVFRYVIDFPAVVTEATLAISPLSDRFGYGTLNTEVIADLMQGKGDFFDLLPGYYLLNLSATYGNMMASWSELVHIYSGLETLASHTFSLGDFKGIVQVSGSVYGGELNGEHVVSAVVTAFSDENYLNRVARVEIPAFTKMGVSPFYHNGTWLMNVSSTFAGRNLYFTVEETRNGPEGTKVHIYEMEPAQIAADGSTTCNFGVSYSFWRAGRYIDSLTYEILEDSTVKITTLDVLDYPNYYDIFWYQIIGMTLPLENSIRYAYEFEAWTEEGDRQINFQHINDTQNHENNKNTFIDLNDEREHFTIISTTRVNSATGRDMQFQVGHNEIKGTLFIKVKSVVPSYQYAPPSYDESPRFTATAVPQGIRLRADYRGLPMEITGVQFQNLTAGGSFEAYWNDVNNRPDFYEVIYPYVDAGKEYRFRLNWQGNLNMSTPEITVTATGGRGELYFTNASSLALFLDGNNLRVNTDPVLSDFNKAGVLDPQYRYAIVSGTSWNDPAAQWGYSRSFDTPVIFDITDATNIPFWVGNPSSFIGRTCFSTFQYHFNYDDDDIYPTDSQRGTFYTQSITTTPYTYPRIFGATFTAEPHPEGVKLIVHMDKLLPQTTAFNFRLADYSSAELWVSSSEFTGFEKAEFIYPFVEAGKTYVFEVDYSGTNSRGRATVTANAGLGELRIQNANTAGASYSISTKTLSYTEPLIKPVFNSSPKITDEFFRIQYFAGINWDANQWLTERQASEVSKIVFDDTFNPALGYQLSNRVLFLNAQYAVIYDGRLYNSSGVSTPSFRFPVFEQPQGQIHTNPNTITTVFEQNNNIYLSYSVNSSGWFNANVNYYYGYYNINYIWYIDGEPIPVNNNSNIYFDTSLYDPGMYYGLAVVVIDGVPFTQEFSFRVGE
ncbi:MAG: hypothetical protein FWD40_06335 [Treponema sp.]|nr:hypothetical protein [Treponema sp.]